MFLLQARIGDTNIFIVISYISSDLELPLLLYHPMFKADKVNHDVYSDKLLEDGHHFGRSGVRGCQARCTLEIYSLLAGWLVFCSTSSLTTSFSTLTT